MPKRTAVEIGFCPVPFAVAKRFFFFFFFFFFFGLAPKILGIWGHVIQRWQGLEHTLPTVYYTPQKNLNYIHKT
jgi:hypothetical protein